MRHNKKKQKKKQSGTSARTQNQCCFCKHYRYSAPASHGGLLCVRLFLISAIRTYGLFLFGDHRNILLGRDAELYCKRKTLPKEDFISRASPPTVSLCFFHSSKSHVFISSACRAIVRWQLCGSIFYALVDPYI